MLSAMVRRLLRQGLAGTAMLLLGVVLFQFIYPFIADSLGGKQGLSNIVGQLPPAMQALAQMSPEFLAMTGVAGFLSRGYDHPVFLVLSIAAMVAFTGRAIAGEVGSGTLALALSRPIPRGRIYLARVIGVAAVCLAFGAAGPIATWAGVRASRLDAEVPIEHLAAMALLGMLFLWAIGGLTLLVSAWSSSTGRVVGWATGYLVVAYFVDVFAELWSVLEPVRPLSLFRWFDTSATMVDGRVPADSAVVLGGVGLATMVVGWVVFRRRDFMV
jgi:ABC-type transport system involved in multi-copper enzyme maturation permease subunit